jgi:hypothetical protein
MTISGTVHKVDFVEEEDTSVEEVKNATKKAEALL